MRRATTPTHRFIFPESVTVDSLEQVLVTYSQDGRTILEKKKGDFVSDTTTNTLSVTLTQDETKLFAPGKALAQLRCTTGNGTAMASQMLWIDVKPVLNSEDL